MPNPTTPPAIRLVALSRPLVWLSRGLSDFAACWRQSLMYGLGLLVFGLLVLWLGWSHSWLLAGAFSGFVLPAPFLACGLYELSRRRDAGKAPAWGSLVYAVRRGGGRLLALGVMLAGIGTAWVVASAAIVVAMHGQQAVGVAGFLRHFLAPDNANLFLLWCGCGGLLAAIVFALTAVSVPMLLDRPVGLRDALQTSVAAVGNNPVTMALWAALIMALTLVAMLTALGLVVLIPVLGHASWHAYRDLIEPA